MKILADGADEVAGAYPVVEPPHRLVFTWTAETTGGRQTRVTVTLGGAADGPTQMTITHERLPSTRIHDGAPAAWRDNAAMLDRHLAGVG